MNKKLITLALIGGTGGIILALIQAKHQGAARSEAQELFPPEKLNGYAQGTKIGVREKGQGGRPVVAVAVTPYGIRPEQIPPTGYGALKALHGSYPDNDWISVFLAEDSAMAEASQWLGVAELRAGKVTLTGGIPGPREIDSLSKLGNPLRRPTQADLKAVATVYDSTRGLSSERWRISRSLMGAGTGRIDKSRFLELDLETAPLHAAAKALGTDAKSLRALVFGVTRYYWTKAGEPLAAP